MAALQGERHPDALTVRHLSEILPRGAKERPGRERLEEPCPPQPFEESPCLRRRAPSPPALQSSHSPLQGVRKPQDRFQPLSTETPNDALSYSLHCPHPNMFHFLSWQVADRFKCRMKNAGLGEGRGGWTACRVVPSGPNPSSERQAERVSSSARRRTGDRVGSCSSVSGEHDHGCAVTRFRGC